MTVLAIITGEGITQKMYDTLRTEVDWANQQPNGALIHVASFDDAGAHVADLWSSPEALNDFVQTRLGPAMKKLNIPMPQMAIYPVHNIDAYPEARNLIR